MKSEKFAYYFLFNDMHQGKPKTFLASSQRLPDIENQTVNAYVKELDDVREINYSSVIATITINPVR
jgi:hypothetical protein